MWKEQYGTSCPQCGPHSRYGRDFLVADHKVFWPHEDVDKLPSSIFLLYKTTQIYWLEVEAITLLEGALEVLENYLYLLNYRGRIKIWKFA